MKRAIIILYVIFQITSVFAQQRKNTDANIVGHVVCSGEHVPYVTVMVKGTTIGTATDETGHYSFHNLPVGEHVLVADGVGYSSKEQVVNIEKETTTEVHFDLREDVLGLDVVVITSDRNEVNRRDASVITTAITPKIVAMSQSNVLAQSLNFAPGLRVENNCQNCGFTQLRMNGLEGAYSQVLINSRPIFSGLAGVYGLELIPSNMIAQVEVIRGGGSALYGSNAIAGTVNLILKEPLNDYFEVGYSSGLIGLGYGNPSFTNEVHANASVVGKENKSGMSLFSFYRNNQPFDANDDTFSEVAEMKNITFGANLFYRPSTKSKLSSDLFFINESRRGGDRFDYPVHEANIAEAVTHNILSGAITYDQYLKNENKISIFGSTMYIDRDSYYGANQSLDAYGATKNLTYDVGANFSGSWNNSTLVAGIENQGEWLTDKKLGYADYANAVIVSDSIVSVPHTGNLLVADQQKLTTGAYAQYEYKFLEWTLSGGLRFDHYSIDDRSHSDDSSISGDVLSPRLNILFKASEHLELRANYSKGYRAPQIFDEDLHIETSGSRQVIHENSDNLKQETSHSLMLSADLHEEHGKVPFEILFEGFYTLLQDPFANEYGVPDSNNVVTYTRVNSDGEAYVAGVNMELTVYPMPQLNAKIGFTYQVSKYTVPQDFESYDFFRSPNDYGFFMLDWSPLKGDFGASLTGTYTGKMLVPYFGLNQADPDAGELIESDIFFDVGTKIWYKVPLKSADLEVYIGMKNIFNSYQNDFDYGVDRDPGYIYGPSMPRYPYWGLTYSF